MIRHVFSLTLSMLILSMGVAGCSEGATNSTVNSKALDRQVLRLQPGMSVEDVRSKLGSPRLERDLGDEEVLYYGLWQLVFTNNELDIRTRYYRGGRWTKDPKALDRKVSQLQLGMSIGHVRSELGRPEALQFERNAPHKEESLWYGNGRWKLSFTDGKLSTRNRF